MTTRFPHTIVSDLTINGSSTSSLVDADQYCELSISARRLVRVDDHLAGLRGLEDVDTGERFMVAEKVLVGHRILSEIN